MQSFTRAMVQVCTPAQMKVLCNSVKENDRLDEFTSAILQPCRVASVHTCTNDALCRPIEESETLHKFRCALVQSCRYASVHCCTPAQMMSFVALWRKARYRANFIVKSFSCAQLHVCKSAQVAILSSLRVKKDGVLGKLRSARLQPRMIAGVHSCKDGVLKVCTIWNAGRGDYESSEAGSSASMLE
jgi:hypothetical protein